MSWDWFSNLLFSRLLSIDGILSALTNRMEDACMDVDNLSYNQAMNRVNPQVGVYTKGLSFQRVVGEEAPKNR